MTDATGHDSGAEQPPSPSQGIRDVIERTFLGA